MDDVRYALQVLRGRGGEKEEGSKTRGGEIRKAELVDARENADFGNSSAKKKGENYV